jgi:hypothetical protein
MAHNLNINLAQYDVVRQTTQRALKGKKVATTPEAILNNVKPKKIKTVRCC